MATLFSTNTKYVSYILQQYRNKNFNDYLNEIRIKYIVRKMVNEQDYLYYKIDYLSEIAGYSSHSRFTQMFKKELKMSPSEFISQLSKKKALKKTTDNQTIKKHSLSLFRKVTILHLLIRSYLTYICTTLVLIIVSSF